MSLSNVMSKEDTISRVGKLWLNEEKKILLDEIINKETYEDIALKHKRTVSGIKAHIICNIIYPRYKNNNISIDDLSNEYNIEKNMIQKYINKTETKNIIDKTMEKTNIGGDNNLMEKDKLLNKMELLEYRMIIIEKKLDIIIENI